MSARSSSVTRPATLERLLFGAVFLAVGALMVTAACAGGNSDRADGGPETSAPAGGNPYTVYWAVGGRIEGERADIPIDFHGAPISRNVIMLYTSMLGRYPKEGPHVLLMDPGYMKRHLARVREDVARWVPSDFDGLAVIDYEPWMLTAERTQNHASSGGLKDHDRDFLDDTEEALERYKPEMLAAARTPEERKRIVGEEYERAAREFYTQTIRLCKELRPKALWGYYRFPPKVYASSTTQRGVVGYGDHDNEASRLNDKLAWLFKEEDALYPSIYALYESVDLPRDKMDLNWQNTEQQDREYVLSNVEEAVRVANGKPVFPIACIRYQNRNPHLKRPNHLLNETNMRNQLILPKVAGANGVVIWGGVKSREEIRQVQKLMDDVIAPAAHEAVETPVKDLDKGGGK